MKKKIILGMPGTCFIGVILVLCLGIIAGSFCDYDINVKLANKTDLGAFLLPTDLIFPIVFTLPPECVFLKG